MINFYNKEPEEFYLLVYEKFLEWVKDGKLASSEDFVITNSSESGYNFIDENISRFVGVSTIPKSIVIGNHRFRHLIDYFKENHKDWGWINSPYAFAIFKAKALRKGFEWEI